MDRGIPPVRQGWRRLHAAEHEPFCAIMLAEAQEIGAIRRAGTQLDFDGRGASSRMKSTSLPVVVLQNI